MESQGIIKSHENPKKAFLKKQHKKAKPILLLKLFPPTAPKPPVVCYCCSFLSVSMPFFTVVPGSARNKRYSQI